MKALWFLMPSPVGLFSAQLSLVLVSHVRPAKWQAYDLQDIFFKKVLWQGNMETMQTQYAFCSVKPKSM